MNSPDDGHGACTQPINPELVTFQSRCGGGGQIFLFRGRSVMDCNLLSLPNSPRMSCSTFMNRGPEAGGLKAPVKKRQNKKT